jgi:hypothetical protein
MFLHSGVVDGLKKKKKTEIVVRLTCVPCDGSSYVRRATVCRKRTIVANFVASVSRSVGRSLDSVRGGFRDARRETVNPHIVAAELFKSFFIFVVLEPASSIRIIISG